MPGTATPIIVPLRESIGAGAAGAGAGAAGTEDAGCACARGAAPKTSLATTPIMVRFILGTPEGAATQPGASGGGTLDVVEVGTADE